MMYYKAIKQIKMYSKLLYSLKRLWSFATVLLWQSDSTMEILNFCHCIRHCQVYFIWSVFINYLFHLSLKTECIRHWQNQCVSKSMCIMFGRCCSSKFYVSYYKLLDFCDVTFIWLEITTFEFYMIPVIDDKLISSSCENMDSKLL